MIDYLIRPVKHQAFFKKYASKKFMKGITLSPSQVTSGHTDDISSVSARS